MKRKALWIVGIVCILGILVSSGTAFAAWYSCKVVGAGGMLSSEGIYIQLTSNTNAWTGARYFILNGTRVKEYLAMALTALSNNTSVNVWIATINEDELIQGFTVLSE